MSKKINKSFAFTQNVKIPSLKAHGVLVVKTCEAMAAMGFTSYLLMPERPQNENSIKESIWNYYQISENCFTVITIHGLYSYLYKILIAICKKYQHYITTLVFALQSWIFLKRKNITIVQTSDPELLIILYVLKNIYKPNIIFDIHIEISKWLPKAVLNIVSVFAVNCDYFQQRLQNLGIPPDKILVLPNGYDAKTYINLPSKTKIRKKLGIQINRFIIGYIGRFETLDKEKGLFGLIKLISKLKNIPIMAALIGGPEDLAEKYRAFARQLKLDDKIKIISQVKPFEVLKYIKTFDIGWLVYPKNPHFQYKMSPMKAIEYMVVGLPIIASDFPSLRQLLPEFGARFVDPDNINSQKRVIEELYNKPKILKAIQSFYRKQHYSSWQERQEKIVSKLKL